jgi:hypothetical protein
MAKRTGADDIYYMVIAENADGSETRKKVEAMDPAAALDHVLNALEVDQDAVSFRVVPMAHWRRLQRAERKGCKEGKVVKLAKKRGQRKGAKAAKRVPASVQRAFRTAVEMGGT